MALNLLTGKTGSAKSYKAIENMLKSFSDGRKVFTNIKLNIEDENYHYMDELAVREFLIFIEDTFKEVSNLEDKKEYMRTTQYFGGDFYIDEAHLVGFRDKKESILNWLTLQRHFNQDITIITQVASNIHRDYLMMFHSHIDMLHGKKRLSKEHLGYKEYDSYKGDRIRTNHFKPNVEIFDIYNSGKKEVGQSQDVKKVLMVFGGLGVAGIILFFNISSLFDGQKNLPMVTDTNISKEVPGQELTQSEDLNITYPTVICDTRDGCFWNAWRYKHKAFIKEVLSKYDFDEVVVMRSKSSQMIKYTLYQEKDLSSTRKNSLR